MMGWYGGMMSGFGAGMGIISWFVQLALFIALIYLAVALIRRVNGRSGPDKQSDTILKERFARGEITEEEYHKMKKVLHD